MKDNVTVSIDLAALEHVQRRAGIEQLGSPLDQFDIVVLPETDAVHAARVAFATALERAAGIDLTLVPRSVTRNEDGSCNVYGDLRVDNHATPTVTLTFAVDTPPPTRLNTTVTVWHGADGSPATFVVAPAFGVVKSSDDVAEVLGATLSSDHTA